jgi:hypothetical protein
MPISTLWSKSMPSTYSRKPWTKCWRDCSPSVTTSMPASSCSFSDSSVASSLPAANSSPASRHCGHSLLGSASQDGFGRLPAMVVGNIGGSGSGYCSSARSGGRLSSRAALAVGAARQS